MRHATSNSITPRFLVALLDEHGVPCDDVLAAAGLTRSELDAPDLRTPWREFGELWRRAAQVAPDVGLALNERFPPGEMHIITHVAMRAETVGEAFRACSRCFSLMSTMERMQFEPEGNATALIYRCEGGTAEIPWLVEHYFTFMRRLLGRALGRSLPFLAVQFRARASAPAGKYLECLGVAPAFSAPRNAVLLSNDSMQWPLPTRDTYLRELLERVVSHYNPTAPTPRWSDRTRACLTNTLLQGRTPTLEATATILATNVTALRERLRAEGQTFRALLDHTRRDLAREHLERGMGASEVAYLLGFSEPSGFQHACRRWFGVAAGAVRSLPPQSETDSPAP